MKSQFQYKLLQTLNKKNGNKGFTLIELLVVVIIIGVLAAIALPNLLGQVAKGRQAEARNNLGTVNRAQQAYRLENGVFGVFSTTATQNNLPVAIQPQYYSYGNSTAAGGTGAPTATGARTNATAIDTYNNDIRDFSSEVAQAADGQFAAIICEANTPDQSTAVAATATAGAADGGTCANGRVVK